MVYMYVKCNNTMVYTISTVIPIQNQYVNLEEIEFLL